MIVPLKRKHNRGRCHNSIYQAGLQAREYVCDAERYWTDVKGFNKFGGNRVVIGNPCFQAFKISNCSNGFLGEQIRKPRFRKCKAHNTRFRQPVSNHLVHLFPDIINFLVGLKLQR